MQLADGRYGAGDRLFSSVVHREMWTPQTIIPTGGPGPYNTHFSAYGLGFSLSDVKGYKQINHYGGLAGMVTEITMIPELQLGIIVLTNQEEDGALNAITNQIKDAYLGIHGTDRVTEYATARTYSLRRDKQTTDAVWARIDSASRINARPIDPSLYAGTYRDQWLGEVVISVKDGKLWFDAKRSPRLSGVLLPYKGNTFVAKWSDRTVDADAFVLFGQDEDGKGSGFTMKPVSPLTDFSYDFQDLDFHRVIHAAPTPP